MPITPADSNAASEMETDDKAPPAVPDAYWAKYNVKVQRPQYTDEQYETHLQSEGWSKEETDYLVDLATEFDLRWIIIIDRYSYYSHLTPPNILRHHIPQPLTQTPNARRSQDALLRDRRQNNGPAQPPLQHVSGRILRLRKNDKIRRHPRNQAKKIRRAPLLAAQRRKRRGRILSKRTIPYSSQPRETLPRPQSALRPS